MILAEQADALGGSLLVERVGIEGAPAMAWVERTVAELRAMPEVRLLPRATVYGYHDHNFLTIAQRLTDHLPPAERRGPRERLWRVRAKQVVLATGAIERPLVFGDNDRPGVMLAAAVRTYLNRFAVRPGERAVVLTTNDDAYRTALDLHAASVPVAAVVDLRPEARGTVSLEGLKSERVKPLGAELTFEATREATHVKLSAKRPNTRLVDLDVTAQAPLEALADADQLTGVAFKGGGGGRSGWAVGSSIGREW